MPAVVGYLSEAGSYLIYTAASATNNLTISGVSPNLTLTASSGTISSTVPGHVTTAASISLSPLPATITSIVINNTGTSDVTNLAGLSTTRSLQVSSPFINVSSALTTGALLLSTTGGNINVMANIASTANAAGGAIDLNGPVVVSGTVDINSDSVTDGSIYFLSTVSGAGALTVGPTTGLTSPNTGGSVTFVGAVNLGSTLTIGNGAKPGANNVAFDNTVLVNGALSISATNLLQFLGNVNDINAASGTITLYANQDGSGTQGFTNSGTITTASGSATGAINVTVNTPTPDTAGFPANSGAGNASIGDLVTAAGGKVIIQSFGTGSITDGNGAGVQNISANSADLTAFGSINLDTAVSKLDAVNGSNAAITIRNTGSALTTDIAGWISLGSLSITNNNTITTPSALLVSAAGNLSLTTTGANNIVVNGSVTSTGGNVTLTSGGDIDVGVASAGTVSAPAGTTTLTAAGNVNVADGATGTVSGATVVATSSGATGVVVDASTGAGSVTGTTVTLTATGAGSVAVGSSGTGGTVTATTANLNATGTGSVTIGNTTATPGTVTATTANVTSATNITMTGTNSTGSITAPTVNLTASTGVGTSTQSIIVGGVAGTTINASTTSGGVWVTDATGILTVASATASTGTVQLSTTNALDLHVAGTVADDSGNIVLIAQDIYLDSGLVQTNTGNITFTPTANIYDSAATTINNYGTGTITVTAPTANSVEVFAGAILANGTAAGTITLNGATGFTTNMTISGAITTNGGVAVTSQGVAAGSQYIVNTPIAAALGTVFTDTGASAFNDYEVAPSAVTGGAYTFTLSGAGTSTYAIEVLTNPSNIVSGLGPVAASSSDTVTFTPSSLFQSWTINTNATSTAFVS